MIAILFDKDGTILDFKYLWLNWCYKIVNEGTKKIPGFKFKELIKVWGVDLDYGYVAPGGLLAVGSVRELKRTLIEEILTAGKKSPKKLKSKKLKYFSMSKKKVEELVDIVINSANEEIDKKGWVRPIKGVPGAIQKFHEMGYKLGVVTTDDTLEAEKHLEALDLKKYFQVVLGCDLVNSCKPSPDLVFEACRQMEIEPSRVVVIGDTVEDVIMGKKQEQLFVWE